MAASVSLFTMSNGLMIPAMGYGVYMMSSEEVEHCLPQAIELGYTHIDTANVYFNEVAVGRAIKASGASRRACSERDRRSAREDSGAGSAALERPRGQRGLS